MEKYQTSTIITILNKIKKNTLIIPAIQREFVWKEEQIEILFDSIMRNYPINSFLMWKINENNQKETYYKIVKDYIKNYKTFGERLQTPEKGSLIILDGQQRITSLYIGLCGSYSKRLPNKWKEYKKENYPQKHLYLFLQSNNNEAENDEDAETDDTKQYNFKFLTQAQYEEKQNNQEIWFEVSNILTSEPDEYISDYIADNNIEKPNRKILYTLKNKIHNETIINYYQEDTTSYDTALQIFIRTNNSGTKLSYEDLLMSTIILGWETDKTNPLNAKEEFQNLKESIREKYDLSIENNVIIRSYLMYKSDNVKFNVDNFKEKNALDFKKEWETIKNAINVAIHLIKSFGHNDKTLKAKNVLLPIIQYILLTKKEESFLNNTANLKNRKNIQSWLNRSLLKGVLGGSSNEYLQKIKDIIDNACKLNSISNDTDFPVKEIEKEFKLHRKNINITEEDITNYLNTPKDSHNATLLLLIIYSYVQKEENIEKILEDKDIDHIFPIKWFTQQSQEKKDTANTLINLQLLKSNPNKAKATKSIQQYYEENNIVLDSRYIPSAYENIEQFDEFVKDRTQLLTKYLKHALSYEL